MPWSGSESARPRCSTTRMSRPVGSARYRRFEEARLRNTKDAHFQEALARVRYEVARSRAAYPKVDLGAFARALGIEEISSVPLGIHGRIDARYGRLRIEVSDRLQGFAKRFTIAHELAHVVLGDRPRHLSYERFEQLCDVCADELLLPDQFLREVLVPSPHPLVAMWGCGVEGDLPLYYVYCRAISAGALLPTEALLCVMERGDVRVSRTYPIRYEHQVADIVVRELPAGPIQKAQATRLPVDGELELIEGGDIRRRLQVTALPSPAPGSEVLIVRA